MKGNLIEEGRVNVPDIESRGKNGVGMIDDGYHPKGQTPYNSSRQRFLLPEYDKTEQAAKKKKKKYKLA